MKKYPRTTIVFLKPYSERSDEEPVLGIECDSNNIHGFDDPNVRFVRIEEDAVRVYVPKSNIAEYREHELGSDIGQLMETA